MISLLTFSQQIGRFATNERVTLAFATADRFKYEIISFLAMVLFWPWIKPCIDTPRSLWEAIREGSPRRASAIVALLAAIGLVGAIGYQGRAFLVGRKINRDHHHMLLATRAAEAFQRQDFGFARLNLEACSGLYPESRCADLLTDLDVRLDGAKDLRHLYALLPLSASGRYVLLEDAYRLDYDSKRYDGYATTANEDIDQVDAEFVRGVKSIAEGQNAAAVASLKEVEEMYPGYRDASRLLEELEGTNKERAYLQALQAMGVQAFLAAIPESVRPARACPPPDMSEP
jgi:hypothetical protein